MTGSELGNKNRGEGEAGFAGEEFQRRREEHERNKEQYNYYPNLEVQIANIEMVLEVLWVQQDMNYGNPAWDRSIDLLLAELERLPERGADQPKN